MSVFDVISVAATGEPVRLGRTWLKSKDGQVRLSFDMSSYPLGGGEVYLKPVSDDWESDEKLGSFSLVAPIDTKEGKKYWHSVGDVVPDPGNREKPFRVLFSSLPAQRDLVGFPKKEKK